MRGHWKLNEGAVDSAAWRIRFRRGKKLSWDRI